MTCNHTSEQFTKCCLIQNQKTLNESLLEDKLLVFYSRACHMITHYRSLSS